LLKAFFDDLWKLQNDDGSFSYSAELSQLLNLSYSSLISLIPAFLDNNTDLWVTCCVVEFVNYKFSLDKELCKSYQVELHCNKAKNWVNQNCTVLINNSTRQDNVFELASVRIKEIC